MYSREAGVTSIADGVITRGWDAIRTEADSIIGLEGGRIALGSIDVTSLGPGYALAVAAYTFPVPTDRGNEQVRSAITLVFKRIAGEWKIIHSHSSFEGLPEPAVTDEVKVPSANTMEAAYVASMKSDLRNLVTAEEAFFADSVRYTAKVGRGGVEFIASGGNTSPIVRLTPDGWTATMGNVNTRTRCAIFVGSTPVAPATKEGQPACT
jgi:ketosteroid isomerase-like protein